MSEMAKTLTFIVAGAAALLVGFVVGPRKDTFNVESLVGERLNQFDIDAPKRLKIVKFDQDTGTAREFEVAEQNGLWVIPSKHGYPADATRQMAEAATCLIDREIFRIAATSASQHEQLGVIDPSSRDLDTQSKGVGIRVVMSDNSKDVLTDMIVGKKVKDTEDQYYVRKADQDVVYVVKLDPEKLTTRFEDWIESDLLKLNPFDIRRVAIQDYTAEMMLSLQGFKVNWDRRAEMVLTYDNGESKWSAKSLKKFDKSKKEFVDFKLADDEQLDEDVLRELRNGLDDLKIVDVERKPEGLSADLKAGEDFVKDSEAASSLMSRGFAPVSGGPGQPADILSTEGEVVCSLQDGVEYVLRFGNLQMETDGATPAPSKEESEAGDEDASKDAGINRYLFVMARFNDSMIEKPKLDDLPELPEGVTEETETAASDEAAGAASTDKPAEEEAAKEADDETAADTAGEDKPAADADGTADASAETAPDAEAAEADTADAEESADGEESAQDDAAAKTSGEAASDEKEEEGDDELSKVIAERKRIENENQRKLDEYQEKITKGKERVDELNERFGDWYYVISNDVYQQVHVGLDKLVEKKEPEKKEGEADAAEVESADEGVSGLPNLQFDAGSKSDTASEPSASDPSVEDQPKAESETSDATEAEPAVE